MNEIEITIENGKITNNKEKLRDLFKILPDGSYIVDVIKLSVIKSEYEYQKQYRAKLKTLAITTGNNELDIHEDFKKRQNISSTTELTTLTWVKFIQEFSWWSYNFFNCVV